MTDPPHHRRQIANSFSDTKAAFVHGQASCSNGPSPGSLSQAAESVFLLGGAAPCQVMGRGGRLSASSIRVRGVC